MRPFSSTIAVLLALALPASASSQGPVIVVDDDGGPGVDHVSLVDAVAAAADGATILVRAGVYPGDLEIHARSLTLIADDGAQVQVQGEVRIEALTASDRVLLRGIDVETFEQEAALRVQGSAGSVWVEDARLEAHYWCAFALCAPTPAVFIDANAVHLVRTEVRAAVGTPTTSSLYSSGSRVFLDTCLILGGHGVDGGPCTLGPSPTPGSSAVRMVGDGFLLSSGSTLLGGDGGNGGGCLFPCDGLPGGHGLSLQTSAGTTPTAVLLDTVVEGGVGGAPGPWCFTPGEDGLDVDAQAGTVSLLPGPAIALTASSPVRENGVLALSLVAPAGSLAWLGVGAAPTFDYFNPLAGVLAVQGPYLASFLGTVPAGGVLALDLPILELAPGVEGQTFFGQAAVLDPLGVLRLGGAGAVTLLDATL